MYAVVNNDYKKQFLDAYFYQPNHNFTLWEPLDKCGKSLKDTPYNKVLTKTILSWLHEGSIRLEKDAPFESRLVYPRVFKDCSIKDWFWYVFKNPAGQKTLLSWDSKYGVRPDPKYRDVDKYESDSSLIEVFDEERKAALLKLTRDVKIGY